MPNWDHKVKAIERASDELYAVVGDQEPHRRGDFATAHWGFAYGLGRRVSARRPHPCSHTDTGIRFNP